MLARDHEPARVCPELAAVLGRPLRLGLRGGLVLSLLLALRQEQAPLPGGALLFCPWIDLAMRLPATPNAAVPLGTADEARRCAAAYLGGHPVDDPVVDPLNADLAGLPPMLIQAATGDARLADAKALAARARDQGADARLELFPVDAHAFQLFWSFLPEAADAIEAAGVFIREVGARGLSRSEDVQARVS